MRWKDTDAPPENLKCKLLTPDVDGDGRTDSGNTICPFHYSSNGGGIKITTKTTTYVFLELWLRSADLEVNLLN